MKLSKVYANQPFKTVKFQDGFNVILGKVTRPDDKDLDSHNLGKSTLIKVIDFLLLKQTDPTSFLFKYADKFRKYTFFLEIQLNDGSFITIKRAVDDPNKISIIKNENQYEDHRETIQWDSQDVPLRNALPILNEYLGFDVLVETNFRKMVSYFLRTQDDYLDVFQLKKYKSSAHSAWKPMLFNMLGFDGKLLLEKYKLDEKIEQLGQKIKEMQQKSIGDSEEIDKINGLIEVKEEEKSGLQNQLDHFNFYQQELKINTKLLDEIETEISRLNSQRYNLDYEVGKITNALVSKIKFNMNEVEEVFNDVKLYFPKELKKNYEELVEFNKLLSIERNKHLKEKLRSNRENLANIDKRLIELNEKQSTLLSVLQDRDAFKKYKDYQNDIIKLESEILVLNQELNKANDIETLQSESKKIEDSNEELKDQIKKQVNEDSNATYSQIRKEFNHIIKEILNSPAIPSIKINRSGNVEFEADIQDTNQSEITAMGNGTTYRKLLCIAFDLSLLITYSKNSFFRFVYHDGALEGLDNRKKMNFLSLIRGICKKYNIQYILTTIEDDLPRDEEGKIITFGAGEVALELNDMGDEGRLFEQSF